MNILFVNNFRGRGGGEEFLRDLLPGLVQKGVKVGLLCRPGTPLVEMFRNTAVNLYPIRRSGAGALTSVFKVANIIRSQNYEIVDIQRSHDIIQSWIGSLLSGKKPVLIYTAQVPEFIKSSFLLGRMDRIVTISRYIAEKLSSFMPRLARKITIIHYGIDLARFTPRTKKSHFLRNRFSLGTDTPIIGTVGDLWKNQIEFLDALVEIRKTFPDARFALVASERGIGQIESFKRLVVQLGLEQAVLWAGRLSKEEMMSFYADIDISVSTHRNEGFGIWILEALAMGKPVVAFNEGGIRDSLENCLAGVLVNGNAGDMAREIVRILKDDDGLRVRMSKAGPSWVQDRFDRNRMIENYVNYFRSVL
jgi:glycosyltransferase involved in cell wall biosynthesis